MRPSLTNRLRIGSAILVVLLAAVSVLGVGRLFQVRQDFEDRSARFYDVALQVERMRSRFVLELASLGEGRGAESERRAAFERAKAESETAAETARRLAEGEEGITGALERRVSAEDAWQRQVAQPVLAGDGPPLAVERAVTDEVISANQEVSEAAHDARAESRSDASDETRTVLLLIVAGLAGALLAAIVLFAGLIRSMRAPLQRLVDGARLLAGGKLSTRVDAEGPAEIAELGQAFNEMATSLERDAAERDRLEQMKDDFLLTVSHELRTPVTSVKGFAEMLIGKDNSLNVRQREAIEAINESAGELTSLVDDLLDLARSDAGRLRIDARPTAVRPLLDRVARRMRPGLEARDQSLTVSSPRGLPRIVADPERISQVLTNLLGNACKFAPEGASVRLSAEPNGRTVKIEVADDGPGIPPDDLQNVFERFWRADSSESQSVGGTGLGLSIARSLVELHDGEISAQSKPGEGTTIAFTIPATEARARRQGARVRRKPVRKKAARA